MSAATQVKTTADAEVADASKHHDTAADAAFPSALAPMTRLPSIRGRLSRALLAWSLVWGAAIALAVWLAADHEVEELLDETLHAAAQVLAASLTVNDPAVGAAAVQQLGDEEHFAWQLVAANGQVVLHSRLAPAVALLPVPRAGHSKVQGWRVFGQALGQDGRMLYVAQTLDERDEARNEVALSAVLAALSVSGVGLLWLRARVQQEMQPLARLSERLARHDPLSRGATLGTAERAELEPVQRAIDDLGVRLARRLAHERAFSSHAAHALRTPLAGIDAQLAVAQREAPPEVQPRLTRVRAAAARLQRVVTALLALFRSDAELQRVPVSLAALVERLPIDGVQVTLDVASDVASDAPTLLADPDLLAAALANLLDNAARHGATHVAISLPSPQTLRVHDDGPGLEADRRRSLQAAVDAQRYEGATGLGLQLADLVARAHGGRLMLPDLGRGFAADLVLG